MHKNGTRYLHMFPFNDTAGVFARTLPFMRFLGFGNDFVLEWRGASVSIAEANGLSSVSTSRPLLTIFIRKDKNRGDPESRLLLVAPGTFFFPLLLASSPHGWMSRSPSLRCRLAGLATNPKTRNLNLVARKLKCVRDKRDSSKGSGCKISRKSTHACIRWFPKNWISKGEPLQGRRKRSQKAKG